MLLTSSPPLVYRVNRIAEMLDISRVSVYRLVDSGQLDLVKTGEKSSGITHASLHRYCVARGIEILPVHAVVTGAGKVL